MLDLKRLDASSFGPASSSDRFSESDITQAEDITKAVEEVVLWTKETGSQPGPIIYCAAAGTPAKVGWMLCSLLRPLY
jgi:hypothetical protein